MVSQQRRGGVWLRLPTGSGGKAPKSLFLESVGPGFGVQSVF